MLNQFIINVLLIYTRDKLSKSVSIYWVAFLSMSYACGKVYTQSSIPEYPTFKHR